jgi:predicted amidohydrolase YtcJ
LSVPEPEIIFHHAQVMTPEGILPGAVAAAGGVIVAVGTNEELLAAGRPGVVRVNMRGLTMVPGFNDCHMHILGYGLKLSAADLSPDAGVRDTPTLIAALRRWADANPHAPWIRGSGYNQNAFPGAEHVQLADLDAAFPDRPLLIIHASGHAALANSRAMQQAGIGPDTQAPAGGEIVRDRMGAPTGVFLESAMSLVTNALPSPGRSQMAEAILKASRALASVGITSASDMGVEDADAEVGAYRDAVALGAPVRITLCPEAVVFGSASEVPEREALAHDWGLDADGTRALASKCVASAQADLPGSLRLGALKLYADGALTTRTAALREPFVDTGTPGMLLHEPETLREYIHAGHARGWQMAVHAIGDRAIEAVIEACETIPDPARTMRRHRIEHCMLLDDSLMARMRAAGMVAVMQPEFLARLGDAYVLGLGQERAARLNPVASLLAAGVPVAFSSDCPVVPGAPLDGIRAASRRRAPSGRVLGEWECVGPAVAIGAYTRGAAYATFDEAMTGAIRVGLRADFAVLSSMPTVPVAERAEAHNDECQVVATIAGGRIVYGAENVS